MIHLLLRYICCCHLCVPSHVTHFCGCGLVSLELLVSFIYTRSAVFLQIGCSVAIIYNSENQFCKLLDLHSEWLAASSSSSTSSAAAVDGDIDSNHDQEGSSSSYNSANNNNNKASNQLQEQLLACWGLVPATADATHKIETSHTNNNSVNNDNNEWRSVRNLASNAIRCAPRLLFKLSSYLTVDPAVTPTTATLATGFQEISSDILLRGTAGDHYHQSPAWLFWKDLLPIQAVRVVNVVCCCFDSYFYCWWQGHMTCTL